MFDTLRQVLKTWLTDPTPQVSIIQSVPIPLEAAERKSSQQGFIWNTGTPFATKRYRRRVDDVKLLSESALPSRAIKLIRDSITSLEYVIRPKDSDALPEETKALKDSIDTVRMVLDNPNRTDDNLPAFIGQIVEDILMFDAGCWEYVEAPDFIENNDLLSLEVVPGYTIEINQKWNGDPRVPRWRQNLGLTGKEVLFLDAEIEYLMQRKRSWAVYGLSPLETVIDIMDAWLGLASYQREVASSAYPAILVYMGDAATVTDRKDFKTYWDNELRGRGGPGFFGNMGLHQKPDVLDLKPTADAGLYLMYQEQLVRTLAFSFGLKSQDFNMVSDVNRNTSEVQQQASVMEARFPIAQLIGSRFTSRVLPRIAALTGDADILKLKFDWQNLTPEDEKAEADIDAIYLDRDTVTIDQVRQRKGWAPLENGMGQYTLSQYKAMSGLMAITSDLGQKASDQKVKEQQSMPKNNQGAPNGKNGAGLKKSGF